MLRWGIDGWPRKILEHRRLGVILAGLALLATLPALWSGLLNDDFCQWAVLAGPDGNGLSDAGIAWAGAGRLSTALSEQFAPLDPDGNLARLKDYGAVPWWTYDGLRVRMWRPLSSLTHWLDYRIFGNSPAAMHAHNLVWLAAVIVLVTMLYRRMIGPAWIAGLAAVMYAVDDFSYFPAMWIANRNVFLSLFFGILCLLEHHRRRRTGSPTAAVTSVLCLAGSLLSAEAGVATCAYLFAYAVVLDRRTWIKRGASLAPAVVVTVLWRLVYNALGHGASGGSFYSDPTREPLRYAWAVLTRGPILIMRQWSGIPADIFNYLPGSAMFIFWPIVLIFVVIAFLVLLPLARADRTARFWLIGMHVSVLPVCATIPMNRNLLFVGIGTCGLIARYLAGFAANEDWVPKTRIAHGFGRWLFLVLLIAHLPFAAIARIAAPWTTSMVIEKVTETMDIGSPEGLAGQDLVVVNAPNPASFFYVPFARAYTAQPLPRAIRMLAPGFAPLEIERKDHNSLIVRAQTGNLLSCPPERTLDTDMVFLFEQVSATRSPDNPLKPGEKIELSRFRVEVLEVDTEGMPVAVLFTFAVPLEDESLRWLQWSWRKDRYYPFELPPVGEKIQIRGPFN